MTHHLDSAAEQRGRALCRLVQYQRIAATLPKAPNNGACFRFVWQRSQRARPHRAQCAQGKALQRLANGAQEPVSAPAGADAIPAQRVGGAGRPWRNVPAAAASAALGWDQLSGCSHPSSRALPLQATP